MLWDVEISQKKRVKLDYQNVIVLMEQNQMEIQNVNVKQIIVQIVKIMIVFVMEIIQK